MGLVAAKCTSCGANIEVDISHDAGICKFCGTAFITEKAINNYITNITNNITNNTNITAQNVHIHNDEINKFFVVEDGVLTKYNGSSKKIKVPEGILEIGDNAFEKIAFEEILIPSSVIRIHKDAFKFKQSDYSSVKRDAKILFAPNSNLEEVEERAFYHSFIYLVEIPTSVHKIGKEAFYPGQTILYRGAYSDFIKSFSHSINQTTIHKYENYCNVFQPKNLVLGNFKELKYHEGFEFACFEDNKACITNFEGSSNQNKIYFPLLENYVITCLSKKAYTKANVYNSVILPDGLTSIPSYAFQEYYNDYTYIKRVFIPNTVTNI